MLRRRGVVRSDDEDAAPTQARRSTATARPPARPPKQQRQAEPVDPAVLELPNIVPLANEHAETLRAPLKLRDKLAEQVANAMNVISDTAVAVEDVSDEHSEHAKALEKSLQEMIDAQQHLAHVQDSVHHVSTLVEIGRKPDAPYILHDIYIDRVQQRDALDAGKTPAEKYGNIAEYLDFKRRVWDVKHENQPAPPTWFPTDADADEEEDDDLIIGQEIQSLKCPITLSLLEKPVRNENCVHVYSYDAIKQLVRQRPGGHVPCPVTGCSAFVTMKTLREDKAMARRVELEKNRLEERMDEEPEDIHEITEGTSMIVEDLKVE